MFIIESDFIYKDYRCITIFTSLGYRCGYVGVPKGNYLYGKHCLDTLPISISELENEEVGKRGIIPLMCQYFSDEDNANVKVDLYFNVHGGITFTGDEHPVECELWWLGFDCGHYNDGKDYDKLEQLWGDNKGIQYIINNEKAHQIFDSYQIRELDYVQQECRNLVDQIIELEEKL